MNNDWLIINTIKYTQGVILASTIEALLDIIKENDNNFDDNMSKLDSIAYGNIGKNDISEVYNQYIYDFRIKLPFDNKDALFVCGLVLKSIFKNYEEDKNGKGFFQVVYLMNRISEKAISVCLGIKKPPRKKLQKINNYLNINIIK